MDFRLSIDAGCRITNHHEERAMSAIAVFVTYIVHDIFFPAAKKLKTFSFRRQPTRNRLKLLPRIINPDEWAREGPLTGPEVRLLRNYNGKPLLTRPQQKFFMDPSKTYLEVDLDAHRYAYIARRAFYGYMTRLASVVFENGFVLQGNRPEELPELLLGAARVHRVDFTKSRPFPNVDHALET